MPDATWNYQPLSIYRPFHASAQKEVLLVGGLGSGKTIALCADAITVGLQQPGLLIGMLRKTVPELRDTLEVEFVNTLPHELYTASKVSRSGGHIESIEFPNGTKYIFRSVDDWQKFKSVNFGRIYIDELSELDITSYRGLVSRLRQRWPLAAAKQQGHTDEFPEWVRGMRAASNSAGKDWMYKRFIGEPDSSRGCWVATTLDNPHLPEDYLELLFSMPKAWVQRYVLCSFDDFGGLIYPDWNYDTHVVRNFELRQTYPVWMGLDPGTRHPTAILYVAVQDRRLVGVHEELASDTLVETWAARMRAIEKRLPPVQWRVADPNSIHIRDRGGKMEELHQQYLRQGFLFQDGPSRHEDRIPMLGTLIQQGRFVVTDACPKTAEQIEQYKWEDLTTSMKHKLGEHAETYGPEKPVKVNDDLVDVAQYLSSRWVRPIKGRKRAEAPTLTRWQEQSADLRETLKKTRARGRTPTRRDTGVVV